MISVIINLYVIFVGQPPHVSIEKIVTMPYEETNFNLTSAITTDNNLPLIHGTPIWELFGGDLPQNAKQHTYVGGDEILHSRLSMYDLSLYDTGTYINRATNYCGTSSASVSLSVRRGMS